MKKSIIGAFLSATLVLSALVIFKLTSASPDDLTFGTFDVEEAIPDTIETQSQKLVGRALARYYLDATDEEEAIAELTAFAGEINFAAADAIGYDEENGAYYIETAVANYDMNVYGTPVTTDENGYYQADIAKATNPDEISIFGDVFEIAENFSNEITVSAGEDYIMADITLLQDMSFVAQAGEDDIKTNFLCLFFPIFVVSQPQHQQQQYYYTQQSTQQSVGTAQITYNYYYTTQQQSQGYYYNTYNSCNTQQQQRQQTSRYVDPLILDLNGGGIQTTPVSRYFNYSGAEVATAWISGGDGFLARDLNGDGAITDGSELFGDFGYENGFAALAALDSNGDGVIDKNDPAFGELLVWADDGNAITDAGELFTLAELEITSIATDYQSSGFVDENGNAHAQTGTYTKADGVAYLASDVWFCVK